MANLGNDIKKYRQGELTPAEMNALERRALNDPFLADALEGSESINKEDFADDLVHIQSAILDRIQKRRIISPWIWTARIAAGLLILTVTGYIIFTLSDVNVTSHNLALNKTSEKPTDKTASHSFDKKVEDIKKKDSPKNSNKPIEHQPAPAAIERTNAMQSSGAEESIPMPEDNKADDELIQDEPKAVISVEPAPTEITPLPSKQNAAEQEIQFDKRRSKSVAGAQSDMGYSAKRVPSKIIRGKVTDAEDGSELPGVNVTIKNSQVGTFTDAEGNYQLIVDNPKAELVFSFIGLHEVEIPVDNHDNLDVKMEPDVSALSEVVVVGYASRLDENFKDESITYQLAEPIGGKKAFKNYLVENMNYPQQAIDNKIQGKVMVQFTVDTNGLLNDFTVLKGIGYGCDEEVIRLVKRGPKWSPTKQNDIPQIGKVKVRLRFKLPDR